MKWNLEDLKEKLIILNQKLKTTNNEAESKYIIQDINMVKIMIDYVISEKVDQRKYNFNWIVDDKEYQKKLEFLDKYLSPIALKLDFLNYSRNLPSYSFAAKCMNDSDFLKLVEKFIANFEFGLYSEYSKLVEDDALNISKTTFYDSSCLGITIYLPTFNMSYVDAIYNGKIKSSTCLPHELAHAYQFRDLSSTQSNAMGYSLFREAFPRFVELAFLDFLKHTKYFKSAMNVEREVIDNVSVIYEFYYPTYANARNLKFVDSETLKNEYGEAFSSSEASKFISKLLAFYFIHEYRTSKDGVKMIRHFNDMFRNQQEYEFFEEVKVPKLIESVRDEFKNYYSDIHKQKKF